MSGVVRTPKGTELKLRDLRGQDYLDVKYRIQWFREEHPTWQIKTTFIERTPNFALVEAKIYDENGRELANAHKQEDKQGFKDFIEKAETGAIGRALAYLGYGTVNAVDLEEEGERVVDAPVDTGQPGSSQNALPPDIKRYPVTQKEKEQQVVDYRFPAGKYKGKSFSEVSTGDLAGYASFFKESSAKKNEPIKGWVKDFIEYLDIYLTQKTNETFSQTSTPQQNGINDEMPNFDEPPFNPDEIPF